MVTNANSVFSLSINILSANIWKKWEPSIQSGPVLCSSVSGLFGAIESILHKTLETIFPIKEGASIGLYYSCCYTLHNLCPNDKNKMLFCYFHR